jgi:hypothetical protein
MLEILYYDVHIPPLVGFPVPVGVAIVVDCLVNLRGRNYALSRSGVA